MSDATPMSHRADVQADANLLSRLDRAPVTMTLKVGLGVSLVGAAYEAATDYRLCPPGFRG